MFTLVFLRTSITIALHKIQMLKRGQLSTAATANFVSFIYKIMHHSFEFELENA